MLRHAPRSCTAHPSQVILDHGEEVRHEVARRWGLPGIGAPIQRLTPCLEEQIDKAVPTDASALVEVERSANRDLGIGLVSELPGEPFDGRRDRQAVLATRITSHAVPECTLNRSNPR